MAALADNYRPGPDGRGRFYMDPGNWATDIAGGSRYNYALIWVLLMSNLMAILLQSLAARLGIVSRRDLAQVCHEEYPPAVNIPLYILAEIAITATDLAEVLVREDVPFREAHEAVGRVVRHCLEKDLDLRQLSREDLAAFHPAFPAGAAEWP